MKKRLALAAVAGLALAASIVVTAWPAQAAVGLRISGGKLVEANGTPFIMRGVNHAHTWYQSQTATSLANIKAAGANSVRVVLASGQRWTKNDTSDVANVISQCKANKLICILEVHDTTGYGEQSGAATLSQAVDYWISVQSALTGQENYVILNIGNEPYGNQGYGTWASDNVTAVQRLRNAGFQHTIMIDAPNWGQDWSFTMRDNASTVWNADTQKNLLFSIHMYGVFDTAAEVSDYLNRFVSAGLPIAVGEFGDMHSDGNPDEDAILSTTQALGLGYLGWSWSGNGGGVEYLDMVTNFSTTFTSWGNRLFNGTNGIKATAKEATIYGGVQPTSAVVTTRGATTRPPTSAVVTSARRPRPWSPAARRRRPS
ncbi:glycoside hydrolase family 5 protein [Luedemannella flava]